MLLRDEIESIISGTRSVTKGDAIQAIANYIRKSKEPGTTIEEKKPIKEQEASLIITYCKINNFLYPGVDSVRFFAEGAEQKVYLSQDGRHVIKLNDSIFYAKWEDYFNSLLLHNFFFPETSYELIGFYKEGETLFSVVEQTYIVSTDATDENAIKEFMVSNGFVNTKNNDFFNDQLGIIIEDLHDENVLTNTGVLFFIDTVFYLSGHTRVS